MAHQKVYERCQICSKAIYPTWQAAARAARDTIRLSGKSRGLRAYWSRSCKCFHVGKSTTQQYDRARRGA